MILRLRVVGVALADPGGAESGSARTFPDGCTVAGALQLLAPPEPDHLAVFVNGTQIHESDYPSAVLANGDELILIRPIDGG